MNLVADEGVERQIVEQLRQNGHTVIYVAELAPSISDDQVLQQANERQAILVTVDKDFGELVFRLYDENLRLLLNAYRKNSWQKIE